MTIGYTCITDDCEVLGYFCDEPTYCSICLRNLAPAIVVEEPLPDLQPGKFSFVAVRQYGGVYSEADHAAS